MSQDIAALKQQLRMLGNEVLRIAADAAAPDAGADLRERPLQKERSLFAGLDRETDALLTTAEALYRERRRRRAFFGEDLFGEPAWDMLLDLYIAQRKGKRVSVTAACLGADVPGTTGLRRLQQLEERGLILREADTKDARRSFVRLSVRGEACMSDYLRDSCRAGPWDQAAASRSTRDHIDAAGSAGRPATAAPRSRAA